MDWQDIIIERPKYLFKTGKKASFTRSRKNSLADDSLTPVASHKPRNIGSDYNQKKRGMLPDINQQDGKSKKFLDNYDGMTQSFDGSNEKTKHSKMKLSDLQSNQNHRFIADRNARKKQFSTVLNSPSQSNVRSSNNNKEDDVLLKEGERDQPNLNFSKNHNKNSSLNQHNGFRSSFHSGFNSSIASQSQTLLKSLDKEYDQSLIGPGSYEGAHWSTFEMIAQKKDSKIHKNKPCFTFGTAKKANEKQFLSREQWRQENLLAQSPPVGLYDPDISKVKRNAVPDISISENTKRFDEYSFKKKVENSSPLQSTIGNGKRLGFPNQRHQHDIVPSPDKYNHKTVFELNQNVGYLIDKPREKFLEKVESSKKLGEISTISQRQMEESTRGPGLYPVHKIEKGLLSQSQSLRVFSFDKAERDFKYQKLEDKMFSVGPGQYFEQQTTQQNWSKNGFPPSKGDFPQQPKEFDIRKFEQRMQIERLRNQRSYI
ncbi:UNKNOWN [Stylonychia lemnae]|uniref:Uncharacterized protein n=1 Tax=Stylonychia lemnae TaxID=5949 RepID=A0A078ANI4_STYLE|nr:UNKNOWN [Stylonychia lemnae]|eukprot:CDW82872.1 UNKNOWN [Stylonychia lemnae]